jgi:DNA-binding IclR family transcriptional regulator
MMATPTGTDGSREAPPAAGGIDARNLGTIARVVELLRVLAEGPDEMSIAGIADSLHLPRATTHRLLTLLREQGMVEHDSDSRRYRVGSEFFRVAALVSSKLSIESLARPIMRQLVAETDETSLLAVYRPHDHRMTFAASERADHALGYTIEMQRPLSIIWGASGRTILAALPDEQVDVVLKVSGGELSPATNAPRPDARTLKAELEEIRRSGYATSLSQRIPHAYSVAAAFRNASGEAAGSISVTLPEMRRTDDTERRLIGPVVQAANQIANLLGYRGVDRAPGDEVAPR